MSDPSLPPDGDFEAAMDMFFREPHPDPVEGWVSTLFLCRKELQDCLIGTVVKESEVLTHEHHRLFATSMVVFAGIELMAGFLPARDVPKRQRIIDFVTTYSCLSPLAVNEQQAAVLLHYRSALSHTFGLFHLGPGGDIVPLFLYDQDHNGTHAPCSTRWSNHGFPLFDAEVSLWSK